MRLLKVSQNLNDLLEQLRKSKQVRAKEVLNELAQRGIKKIGKDNIVYLEQEDEVEYDTIMSFYQSVLQKEREAFEKSKKQKKNDVEIWAHAKKTEERKTLTEYCKKFGARDVELIQKAIEERHVREAETKKKLISAVDAFDVFKNRQLEVRAKEHE